MSKAADWIEILQLKSAYSWHYDAPDFEALVDLFTDDAVCDFGPYGVWTGKQEIRDGFRANVAAAENRFASLHAITNPLIEIDGDEATGRYYLLDNVLDTDAGESTLRVVGIYYERYRREDGRWRITHSRIHWAWSSELGRVRSADAMKKLDWHPEART